MHPLLAQIYKSRGVTHIKQVDYQLKHLYRPEGLLGVDQAVELLIDAIQNQHRILVVGDFDADGATATALVIRSMRAFGAKHIGFIVPNRFDYGYGLSPELVNDLASQKPDLLITVDNGISSHKGVALAKSLGMKVIVTDHHLPAETLPDADAIINPNLNDDAFPSKNLAGVGVAFYLMARLKSALQQIDWFNQHALKVPNVGQWLDLVALGTVADVVKLDENNRILVNAGLNLMKKGRSCFGIQALFDVANRPSEVADSSSLGFVLAPRLNAAGRLEDMSVGIDLLLTDDRSMAKQLAQELDGINKQRREIQESMQNLADSVVKQLKQDDALPMGLCLYHKDWHQGVVGLLASRVKEAVNRPTIVFALENEGSEWLKGSARSITGFHIRDALVEIDSEQPEVIQKFGGHAMAAGLTIHQSQKKAFLKAFDSKVKVWAGSGGLAKVVDTDGVLPSHFMFQETAQTIKQSGPWGEHFPEPLFDGWFEIKNKKEVGQGHTKLALKVEDDLKQVDAIAFNIHPSDFPSEGNRVQICYQMDINEFRGRTRLQLIVRNIIY
nr:single-stranded-DNA-specific exonuclease RecJ [Marinicella rhabdoformis]